MTDDRQRINELQRSVEQLEAKLAEKPTDIDLMVDLSHELFSLAEYKDDPNPTCVKLKAVLARIPADCSDVYFLRGCVAHLDGDEPTATKWHLKALKHIDFGKPDLIEFEDLFLVYRYYSGLEVRREFVQILIDQWGDIPETRIAQGWEAYGGGDREQALDFFSSALDEGPSSWLAAWGCGMVYYDDRNWRSAVKQFRRALRSEAAQEFSEIHFDYAWCLGRTKQLVEEEQAYRACLKLEPDFPNALNNLGYCLYKQQRYEEALKIFDDSIKKGNDGNRYPFWNKARTLTRLGRYSEAIDVLKQIKDSKGRVLKSAMKEIARLEELIRQAESNDYVDTLDRFAPELFDADEDDDVGIGEIEEPEEDLTEPGADHGFRSGRTTPIHAEDHLESFIEQRIQRGEEVFDMVLEMFETEHDYGRQLVTAVGRIDLLAVEKASGDLVVIELKRGLADDSVVGQVSRYMTWVRENIARDGQQVKGIVCVHKATENLKFSSKAIPGLSVYEYDFYFKNVVA